MGSSLNLCYSTWSSLDHCDRDSCAILPKYLGHADFSAQQSTEHILSSLPCCRCFIYRTEHTCSFSRHVSKLLLPCSAHLLYSLISISTPAGRFNRVSASTVLLVGSI